MERRKPVMKQPVYRAQETVEALGSASVMVDAVSRAERPPRLLLTVEEAAERIGICRSNMFKLIRRGEIQSVGVGRLRRVTPDALEDFVRRLSAEEDPAD
jgi:excisionase family DNA binding protein